MRRMDLMPGHSSRKMLLIQELLTQVIRGLEADLASKINSKAETLRTLNERHALASTKPARWCCKRVSKADCGRFLGAILAPIALKRVFFDTAQQRPNGND